MSMIMNKAWLDVPAEEIEGLEGVTIRWLISKKDGAPNFCMRLFEVQPGCSTPFHDHDWEHEMFILEGDCVLNDGQTERPLKPWDFSLVPAGDEHNLKNVGDGVLRLLCFVPNVEGAC